VLDPPTEVHASSSACKKPTKQQEVLPHLRVRFPPPITDWHGFDAALFRWQLPCAHCCHRGVPHDWLVRVYFGMSVVLFATSSCSSIAAIKPHDLLVHDLHVKQAAA